MAVTRNDELSEELEMLELDREISLLLKENMELRARLIDFICEEEENDEVTNSDPNLDDDYTAFDTDDNGSFGMTTNVSVSCGDVDDVNKDQGKKDGCDVVSSTSKGPTKQSVSSAGGNRKKRVQRTWYEDYLFQCGAKLKTEKSLGFHKMLHTGERPFECEKCEKTFIRESNFKQHQRNHEEEAFPCQYCEQKYFFSNKLNAHMNEVHKGIRPTVLDHSCSLCDMKFSHLDNLMVHTRAYHDEKKPLVCDICGQKFIRKNKLQDHKWVHEDGKYN